MSSRRPVPAAALAAAAFTFSLAFPPGVAARPDVAVKSNATVSAHLSADVRADLRDLQRSGAGATRSAQQRIDRAVKRLERARTQIDQAAARGEAEAQIAAARTTRALGVAASRLIPLLKSSNDALAARAGSSLVRIAQLHAEVAAKAGGEVQAGSASAEVRASARVLVQLSASVRDLVYEVSDGAGEALTASRAAREAIVAELLRTRAKLGAAVQDAQGRAKTSGRDLERTVGRMVADADAEAISVERSALASVEVEAGAEGHVSLSEVAFRNVATLRAAVNPAG